MPVRKLSSSTDGAPRVKPLAGGSPPAAVALFVCGLLILSGHPCTSAPRRIRLGIINAGEHPFWTIGWPNLRVRAAPARAPQRFPSPTLSRAAAHALPTVTYHLEVLSGVVEAAKPFYKDVVVYVEPFTANGNLGWRKLAADYPGRIVRTPTQGPHVLLPRHDVLFFVSPEYVGCGRGQWLADCAGLFGAARWLLGLPHSPTSIALSFRRRRLVRASRSPSGQPPCSHCTP